VGTVIGLVDNPASNDWKFHQAGVRRVIRVPSSKQLAIPQCIGESKGKCHQARYAQEPAAKAADHPD